MEKLKTLLASEQFIDSWDDIAADTKTVLGAYRTAYCDLFDRRKKSYESAIGEIKNRTEWAPLEASNPGTASSLLSPLQGRVGTDDDKEATGEVAEWSNAPVLKTGARQGTPKLIGQASER